MTQQHTVAIPGRFWAWVPATLLGAMLLGLGTMAYIAIDDPSFALEPNYYDKAVHWDRSQAEARDSQVLGLRLSLRQAPAVSAQGEVELLREVRDRQARPLPGAAAELEAIPNAFAARLQRISLQEASPGLTSATNSSRPVPRKVARSRSP